LHPTRLALIGPGGVISYPYKKVYTMTTRKLYPVFNFPVEEFSRENDKKCGITNDPAKALSLVQERAFELFPTNMKILETECYKFFHGNNQVAVDTTSSYYNLPADVFAVRHCADGSRIVVMQGWFITDYAAKIKSPKKIKLQIEEIHEAAA
jgi:hypothetical protein